MSNIDHDIIDRINTEMLFSSATVPGDMLVLFGCGSLTPFVALAALEHIHAHQYYPDIICTGGIPTRKTTSLSDVFDPDYETLWEFEADTLTRILKQGGVPENTIAVDRDSENTEENITNAMAKGLSEAVAPRFFCPPYLQKRAMMTYHKHNPEGTQYLTSTACYPVMDDFPITKDTWHLLPHIANIVMVEAWKAGVIDIVPDNPEDGDARDYVTRGYIEPFDHRAAQKRAVALAKTL